MSERFVIVLPRRVLIGTTALVIVALGVLPWPRQAIGDAVVPRAVADAGTLERQRTAAEDAIHLGYAAGIAQLEEVRKLTLAISDDQADAIEGRARADLATVRRDALAAIGGLTGATAVESYVSSVQARLDAAPPQAQPGVLLAPGLFNVVERAGQLFTQVADSATRQLTGAPAPTSTP